MTNLIITPVFRAYDKVLEMCEAIDKLTVNPYVHILVDDDSDIGEFPVKASEKRRILLMKRDYTGVIHKNGAGQAIQLALCWAYQKFLNEYANPLPYDNVFLIESDVIPLEEGWDQKMVDIKATLPEDWLTLDVQSVDTEGKLTYPTTVAPRIGMERDDLEIMYYPDFQCCLFNLKIFESKIRFSDFASHFDKMFGEKTIEVFGGRHFRTTLIKVLHYTYQSRQYLDGIPKQ